MAQVSLPTGAGAIFGPVPAPPERTECIFAAQVSALLLHLRHRREGRAFVQWFVRAMRRVGRCVRGAPLRHVRRDRASPSLRPSHRLLRPFVVLRPSKELVSGGPLPLYVSEGGHTPGHLSLPAASILLKAHSWACIPLFVLYTPSCTPFKAHNRIWKSDCVF